MARTPTDAAQTYFTAWKAHDFDTLRSLLADDVTFSGPLGACANADEYIHSIKGLSRIMTDVVVERIFEDGDDVITWFDLHTTSAPPVPVANFSHLENGLISRVRVAFDPRELTR